MAERAVLAATTRATGPATDPTFPRRRILMLIPQLGYGGAQGALGRLANTFSAAGHEVTVAMFRRHNRRHAEGGVVPAATLVVLDRDHNSKVIRWARRWHHYRALKRVHDVSISFLAGANLLNVATGTRTPTIVSERGTKRYDAGMTRLQAVLWPHVLDPIIYRGADRVVSASHGLTQEIAGPIPSPDRFVTIAGYIDAAALVRSSEAPIEPDFAALAGDDIIMGCGRLHQNKGFMPLLDAFAKVKARVPSARLLIIGDGPLHTPMTERCAALGLTCRGRPVQGEADVYLPGYRETPVRYFRLAKAFAFPSVSEGLPNTLLEALAAGAPLYAADCPHGPREILFGWPGPERRALPKAGPLGTLMSMIADDDESWVEELSAALQRPTPARPSTQTRMEMLGRYDVRRSNRAWQTLVDELCGTDAPARED